MLKGINLQLFADEVIEDPIEEVVEIIEEIEEPVEEAEEPQEPDKDKYIPKDVALQWKREKKELQKQLRSLKEKEIETESKSRLDKIRKIAKEKGLDDDVADIFGEIAGEILSSIPRQDMEEIEIMEDIREYTDIYPDILDRKKEIIDKVKKFRKADPDFSIDDAYRLLTPKKSVKEIELEAEQKALLARRTEKEPRPASPSPVKDKYPLTDDDRRIVKKMQQADPNGGWTNEKYWKLIASKKI